MCVGHSGNHCVGGCLGLGVDFPNRLSRKKGAAARLWDDASTQTANEERTITSHGLCLCDLISWFDPPLPTVNESWHSFTPPQVIRRLFMLVLQRSIWAR